MFLREVILQRAEIHERPAERAAKIEISVGPDDDGEAGNAQALCLAVSFLDGFGDLGRRGGQQRLQLLKERAASGMDVLAREDQAQVIAKAARDRVVQRKLKSAGCGLLLGNAALIRGTIDRRLRKLDGR